MGNIELNIEEFRRFKNSKDTGPVVMLNLLKFKPDGGAEQYGRYASAVDKMLKEIGGKALYSGHHQEMLTGVEEWDAILIIQYPSRSAFLKMISTPEYQKAHQDREAALERAVLYATSPGDLRLLGK